MDALHEPGWASVGHIAVYGKYDRPQKQLERHALGMVYGRNLAHDANNYRETRFTHNKYINQATGIANINTG